MILDKLENFRQYIGMHRNFALVAEWLEKTDLSKLPSGRSEIVPNGIIYVNVQDDIELKDREIAKPEVHRKYIDIQVVVKGGEEMGWLPMNEKAAAADFDEERDIAFVDEYPVTWCHVGAGEFTIFFPNDLHAPCCGNGIESRKIVVKVLI